MKKLRIVVIILLLLALLALGGYLYLMKSINGPFKNVSIDSSLVKVTVEDGATTADIAEALYENGVISDIWKYRVFSKLNQYDGKYIAGTYNVSPGMTSEEIAEKLTSGETATVSFTIPEGYTVYKIADKLSEEGLVSKDVFMDIVENGDFSEFDFLEGTVTGAHRLEGFLFPETYTIHDDASEEDIIRAMLSQFQVVWDKYKDRANELQMTPNEVITIASLIEREAVLDEDRKNVASVIYNRLNIGMQLQIDATINFALDLIGQDHEYLTYDDLEIDSPYNTYQIEGLPPGPIACPGERCIEAALYPPDTEYVYYVKTTDQGVGMSFSTNYEDFMRDVEAWNQTIVDDGN